jgi:hypothetical protein
MNTGKLVPDYTASHLISTENILMGFTANVPIHIESSYAVISMTCGVTKTNIL